MRAAAADLDFEEAARLRDELKRLRATELAVIDDPTAKHPSLPSSPAGEARRAQRGGVRGQSPSKVHKPALYEMGIALHHETKPARGRGKTPRKPALDEMGPGIESIPGKSIRGKPDASGPRSTLGRPGMRGGWRPRGR
jgi:excinuclease ABC subunit B